MDSVIELNFIIMPFFAIVLLILFSFQLSNLNFIKTDSYEVLEPEKYFETPAHMMNCSQDVDCPEYAEALFWAAAKILSEADYKSSTIEGANLNSTNTQSGGKDLGKQVFPYEVNSDTAFQNYMTNESDFQRGLAMLKKADNAGSLYASNELGLLYMKHKPIQDLSLAEMYFRRSVDNGDFLGAYNLARIVRKRNPEDNRAIIEHLKLARQTNTESMTVSYMLGLEAFGTEREKLFAKIYFIIKPKMKSYYDYEFKKNFGLIEQE